MDIEKLIYSECQSPVKVRVYNGITNTYEVREVPCGKCYHCKITRINEWVTRMVCTAMYNKYVYYGTLTYSGTKNTTKFHEETLPIYNNFNKKNHYNYAPTILRKDHLQKFFKRLRKNTGVKFQYCACGEYGSTYGRPHFHYILFTNEQITEKDIKLAWSAPSLTNGKRKYIGKIEHRDIKNNPYITDKKSDPADAAYKYVCKYIQKSSFNFNELPNIKQHEKVFNTIINKRIYWQTAKEYVYTSPLIDDYIKSKNIQDFDEYKKVFRPFFISSKKPAIGMQYLLDNLKRFKEQDYSLHGISKEYIMPLYFIRKTKESLCPFSAQSETNYSKTSYSRLPKMATLLSHIEDALTLGETTNQIVQLYRYNHHYGNYTIQNDGNIQDLEQYIGDHKTQYINEYNFTPMYLSFYDIANHVFYSFHTDHYTLYKYNPKTKTDEYIDNISLTHARNIILYYYEQLKKKMLLPLMEQSKISANKKTALIEEHGGLDKFNQIKQQCLTNLNNRVNHKQRIYKSTKTFE